MDVSGENNLGNHKFLAIVIGTEESINSLYCKIGIKELHMRDIQDKQEQEKIIEKISFDGENRITFCIKIDRDKIMNKIRSMRRIKQKRTADSKILKTFHYLLFKEIKEPLELFTIKHKTTVSELFMQCDSDCINIAKDISIQRTKGDKAWRIADVIAWFNNSNIEPKGVIPLDLSTKIQKKLLTKLYK